MKRALITGITGQDGSYLAELLLEKGYEVHGLVRRVSTGDFWRIEHIAKRLILHNGDLLERGGILRLLKQVEPDEVYNLGALSFVKASFDVPEYVGEVDGLAVVRLLDAVRSLGQPVRMYHASTSEMFGATPAPQSESSTFRPQSPYGCAKLYAHWSCVNAREAHKLHVSCGILFNHESPRRGLEFVTRKIARGAARIWAGIDDELVLGNLDARRDWGHAKDFVEAMWLMLQQDVPDDYVVATGETHTVKEFCAAAFAQLGLDWQDYVKTDPAFFRPTEVHDLRGEASKARQALGWRPKITFEKLVHEMVETEIERAR